MAKATPETAAGLLHLKRIPPVTQPFGGPAEVPIAKDVKQALMSDPGTGKAINVYASGGTIILRGKVKSESTRKIVEGKVRKVAGVSQVFNLLQVKT